MQALGGRRGGGGGIFQNTESPGLIRAAGSELSVYCCASQTALLSCDRGKSHDACFCVLVHFFHRAFTSAGEAGDVQQPDPVAEHRFLNAQGGPEYLKERVVVVVVVFLLFWQKSHRITFSSFCAALMSPAVKAGPEIR